LKTVLIWFSSLRTRLKDHPDLLYY